MPSDLLLDDILRLFWDHRNLEYETPGVTLDQTNGTFA